MRLAWIPPFSGLVRALGLLVALTSLSAWASPLHILINETLRFEEGKCTQDPPHSGIRTVVIDAGHGGRDPGCLGASSREKHIVLGIAQRFAALLRENFPELEVIMTRDDDTFIPLHVRAAIANRARADLFISIHANFMPGSQATKGSETYVMGLHTAEHNLSVAKRENAAILLEADYEANYDYDPNSDEGHILMAMVQSAYLDQSILFAEQVERQLEAAGRKSRGVKQAGFVVLKETAMPSVLVESGFLSNRSEEAYLLSEAGQQEVANALLEAFRSYKQLLEGGNAAVANIDEASLPLVASIEEAIPQYTRGAHRGVQANEIQSAETATDIQPPATAPSTSATYTFEEATTGSSQQTNTIYRPESEVIISETEESELLEPIQAVYTPNEEQQLHARELPPRQRRSVAAEVPTAPNSIPRSQAAVVERASQGTAANVVPAYEYCLQLAASQTVILDADERWSELGWPISQVQEDGLFKYQLRSLGSAQSSLLMQTRVREAGFGQAFIVVYRNGQKLDPAATRLLLSE